MPIKCPVCGSDHTYSFEGDWRKCHDCRCEFNQSKRTTITLTVEEIEHQLKLREDWLDTGPRGALFYAGGAAVWRSLLERKPPKSGDD
jgi:hypothetical protein